MLNHKNVLWKEEYIKHTFNIVRCKDDLEIQKHENEIINHDCRYHVEINNSFYTSKKTGFFRKKEKSIYDIIKESINSNYNLYDFNTDLQLTNLDQKSYRTVKSISKKELLLFSIFVDVYNNRKYFLIRDDMFWNANSFCFMISFVLREVRKRNGSLIWLTTKSIDEIDDFCDELIQYDSDTYVYTLQDQILTKTKHERRRQTFNIEYKENDYSMVEEGYDIRFSLDFMISDAKKLEFLKYYLRKYDLELIDLHFSEHRYSQFLFIGLKGKDCFMALYDIFVAINAVSEKMDKKDYIEVINQFRIIDVVYLGSEFGIAEFIDENSADFNTISCDESKFSFDSYELQTIGEFTALMYDNIMTALCKRDIAKDREAIIYDAYRKYISQSNETIIKGYPKSIIVDLSEESVAELVKYCSIDENTPDYDIINSDFIAKDDDFAGRLAYEFSKQRILEKKETIRYLLGQLSCVHKHAKILEVDDGNKYDDTIWCESLYYFFLYALGYSANILPQFQPIDDTIACILSDSKGLKPTLSPNDPDFDYWWISHKKDWI